jgi:hypothetical protein
MEPRFARIRYKGLREVEWVISGPVGMRARSQHRQLAGEDLEPQVFFVAEPVGTLSYKAEWTQDDAEAELAKALLDVKPSEAELERPGMTLAMAAERSSKRGRTALEGREVGSASPKSSPG